MRSSDAKLGMIVKLASGGPTMTIISDVDDFTISVKCMWFDTNNHVCEDTFDLCYIWPYN